MLVLTRRVPTIGLGYSTVRPLLSDYARSARDSHEAGCEVFGGDEGWGSTSSSEKGMR